MLIARHVRQFGTKDMAQESLRLQFDFVVTKNSIYTPGSGPEVPEPTPMADHDRDGFIISEINNFKGKFTYIVSWKDKPHLLVSVRPQKIRDYVSARSYEEWNTKKMVSELGRLDTPNNMLSEGTGPKLKDKPGKKRKRKKLSQRPAINQKSPNMQEIFNIKHQESTNSLSIQQAPPTSTKTQDLSTSEIIDSVKIIQPTLETKVNGADQISVRDNPIGMNMAQTQPTLIKEWPMRHNDSRPKRLAIKPPTRIIQNYQSLSESSSDINTSQKFKNLTHDNPGATRHSTRSIVPCPPQKSNIMKANSIKSKCRRNSDISFPKLLSSTGCTDLETNENNNSNQIQARKVQNLVEDYFKPERCPGNNLFTPALSALHPGNETDSEVEYEVEDIRDEKWEQDKKGNGVLFYLIKWKGSQIYTWEPEENIGSDVLAEYTANKLARTGGSYRQSSNQNINHVSILENNEEFSHIHKMNLNYESDGKDNKTKTRKAKQKAMAINMFEPEIPNRKRGGIPGDLGDEDELFQVAPIRRRRSGTKR